MTLRRNSTRFKFPATYPIVTANFSTEMNNRETLNTDGRSMLDCTKKKAHHKKKRLLNSKNVTKITTMNVRTLKAEPKLLELTANMRNQGINILGLVEHKRTHEGNIDVQQIDQHVIITLSAWRNNANAAVGGAGVVVSKYAENTLVKIIKYTDRILVAHSNGNTRTTTIIHYAPCEGSDESEEHYFNLATATTAIPKHNTVIVMGDLNAHLGADDGTYTFHISTNSNGKLIIDYLQETNLMIGNTSFRKKKVKLWTYI